MIDNNSGIETAAFFGRAMDEGDKTGREIALKAGNKITELEPAEVQRWRRTASTVESDWVKEVSGKGIDGARLLSEAKASMAKYTK